MKSFLRNAVFAAIFFAGTTQVYAESANCKFDNLAFQGSSFKAWVNGVQKKGDFLVVSLRYRQTLALAFRLQIDAESKGKVEVLDNAGNLYVADPKDLTDAGGYKSGDEFDVRIRIKVDEKFQPPFDLMIRSGKHGSADFLNVPIS